MPTREPESIEAALSQASRAEDMAFAMKLHGDAPRWPAPSRCRPRVSETPFELEQEGQMSWFEKQKRLRNLEAGYEKQGVEGRSLQSQRLPAPPGRLSAIDGCATRDLHRCAADLLLPARSCSTRRTVSWEPAPLHHGPAMSRSRATAEASRSRRDRRPRIYMRGIRHGASTRSVVPTAAKTLSTS